MGETTTTGEEEVKDPNAETGAEDQEETQTDGEKTEEEQGDSPAGDENTKDKEQTPPADDKKPAEEKKPAPADEEPKTRKRNADFIIKRQSEKIQKLKEKTETKAPEEEEEAEESDDEDFIDEETKKVVEKQVKKQLQPFYQQKQIEEDAAEINSFISKNPDFAPYVPKVTKFAQHSSRANTPIESIFYEVAGPDLLAIGAARAKKADEEAKESGSGGGTSTTEIATKPVMEMTDEEFAGEMDKVRSKSQA